MSARRRRLTLVKRICARCALGILDLREISARKQRIGRRQCRICRRLSLRYSYNEFFVVRSSALPMQCGIRYLERDLICARVFYARCASRRYICFRRVRGIALIKYLFYVYDRSIAVHALVYPVRNLRKSQRIQPMRSGIVRHAADVFGGDYSVLSRHAIYRLRRFRGRRRSTRRGKHYRRHIILIRYTRRQSKLRRLFCRTRDHGSNRLICDRTVRNTALGQKHNDISRFARRVGERYFDFIVRRRNFRRKSIRAEVRVLDIYFILGLRTRRTQILYALKRPRRNISRTAACIYDL